MSSIAWSSTAPPAGTQRAERGHGLVYGENPFESATRVVATWIARRRVWSADEERAAG